MDAVPCKVHNLIACVQCAEADTPETPLPKGVMIEPRVSRLATPDSPNAPRHAALAATWQPGQRWETLVQGCEIWVPVATPTWDDRQEYRRV